MAVAVPHTIERLTKRRLVDSFENKVVVVTGGATGIGFAFARRFGTEGAKVVLAGRRESRLRQATALLIDSGVQASYFTTDVSDRQQVERLADFTWQQHGRADVIVNSAGIVHRPKSMIHTSTRSIEEIFAVNFYGVWNGSTVFARRFIEQGTPAAIYNIGSENSLFNGTPYCAPYVASKHAVLAITEELAAEMPDHVDVRLICPGFVKSELDVPVAMMSAAMDTDHYVDIAFPQLKNDGFFVVSHAHNIVPINQRHNAIENAYQAYAPRYEGDNEFDVRHLATTLFADPRSANGHT